VLLAQGRDLSGQRPDETTAVCRRAGNEVVVPTVQHSIYGCLLPVHAFKIALLTNHINLTVVPVDVKLLKCGLPFLRKWACAAKEKELPEQRNKEKTDPQQECLEIRINPQRMTNNRGM